MTGTTARLADYVVGSRLEDMPDAVRHEGRRAFVNWMGCALGGASDAAVSIAVETFAEFSGPREAGVLGRDTKLDIFDAAFVNSLASALHSYNDTHFATVAHPTSPVAAALFAYAERRPVGGAAFLHALILGIEMQCRIGNILCRPPAECAVGLSMVGLVGGIGAAIAVGKVLGLDRPGMARAIGIAANQSCGLREAHATMSSHFTAGHAASTGLMSAILAAKGFTCSDRMLEGPKGFAVSYAANPNLAAATDGLGSEFEILTLAYKPYPCGFVIHPVIDACLDLVRREPFDPAAIEEVRLSVNPLTVQLTDRPDPADRLQALVSYQHWTAAALIRGTAGLQEGAEAAIQDPAVRALRAKVRAEADETIGREEAKLSVTLRDGRVLSAHVHDCRGSINRPLTDEELSQKFDGQATLLLAPAQAQELRDACWQVDRLADISALSGLARGVSDEPTRVSA